MLTGNEEYYLRAREIRAAAAEEVDPDRQEELLAVADEYAELIKLLREA